MSNKFSDFIRNLGTAGPAVQQGIRQLGFAYITEITAAVAGVLRFDQAQSLNTSERTQARTNLGLGSLATLSTINNGNWSGTALAVANGGTGSTTASAARTALGLVIGTNVQAYDAGLQSIAALTTVADRMIYTTASDVYAVTTLTAFGRSLIDDADADSALTTLGVSAYAKTLLDDLDAAAARTTLALGNVDNTSDAAKPVSTATQTQLNLKAPLASPALTGNPTAPTQAPGNNSTRLATTAYADAAVALVTNDVVAWVSFNGTGTPAILASKNVSSVTRTTTGIYIINFTNPLEDANYAVAGSMLGVGSVTYSVSTSAACTISVIRGNESNVDSARISVVFTR